MPFLPGHLTRRIPGFGTLPALVDTMSTSCGIMAVLHQSAYPIRTVMQFSSCKCLLTDTL